jgi:hypothetical protein
MNMVTRSEVCVITSRLNGMAAGLATPSYCTDLTFVATGTYQTMTILTTGNYRIDAAGAQGGAEAANYDGAQGGLGAKVSGTVALQAGDVLCVIVGMRPTGPLSAFDPGGGGGGSFVFKSDATCGVQGNLLAVAGGGAGGKGTSAAITTDGKPGAAAGGINGNGGSALQTLGYHTGGAGAGWYTVGQQGSSSAFAGGGQHWAGGAGGNFAGSRSSDGGFGGGGGAGQVCNAGCGSGGGGGYGGGGGGSQIVEANGGGGGSYVTSTATRNSLNPTTNAGHGFVTIKFQ